MHMKVEPDHHFTIKSDNQQKKEMEIKKHCDIVLAYFLYLHFLYDIKVNHLFWSNFNSACFYFSFFKKIFFDLFQPFFIEE